MSIPTARQDTVLPVRVNTEVMQSIFHSGLATTASIAAGKEGTSQRQRDYSLLA